MKIEMVFLEVTASGHSYLKIDSELSMEMTEEYRWPSALNKQTNSKELEKLIFADSDDIQQSNIKLKAENGVLARNGGAL